MLEGTDFAYVNFDDERLAGVSDYDKAIRQVYGETKVLLFDEIQDLRNWELFVNRLQRRGFNIILTWDYMAEKTHGAARITFLPLWRWLIGR